MVKCLYALLLLALGICSESAWARIQAGGRSLDGEEITVDLPDAQHMRNVGGSDGAGLCVFTSIQHSGKYQNIAELDGFRDWMRKRPGGGYPEKVDATIAQYTKQKGVASPSYVQHTGGDLSFLRLGLKTGRYVCVTYDGRDGVHYAGPIAHMVNLVHLSNKWAVIHDNNFPGEYLWMSPAEFESRWKGNGGGWAIVFLNPPPPPVPTNNYLSKADPMFSLLMTASLLGQCPGGQCPGGNCPAQAPISIVVPTSSQEWEWKGATLFWKGTWFATLEDGELKSEVGGRWVTINYPEGVKPPSGAKSCKSCKDCLCKQYCKCKEGVCPNCPIAGEGMPNYGIDLDKINTPTEHIYTKNGRRLGKHEAYKLLEEDTFPDDSLKPHLTIVGPPEYLAKVKEDFNVNKTLSSFKNKLLIQYYPSSHWMVEEVGLAEGASYQNPALEGKAESRVEFRLPPSEYTPEALAEAIRKKSPNYDPAKDPDPNKPSPSAPTLPSGPETPNGVPTVDLGKYATLPNILLMGLVGLMGYQTYNQRKQKGS